MNKSMYDVVTLIELVENHPCLWDKTADSFKDRIAKQKAWQEIYIFLEGDFLQKEKKEQHTISAEINGKWQNIRDAFVRSLRKKSGQGTKRKYLYHDNLTFLLKVVQSDDTESSIDDFQHDQQTNINENQNEEEAEVEIEVPAQKDICTRATKNTRKRTHLQDDVDKKILKALENPLDEDEAFFISITPSVRKMSEDDKLDFRMSVLQLIKNINRRKAIHPGIPPISAGASTPTSFSISSDSSTYSQHAHSSQQNQQHFSSWNRPLPYDDSNINSPEPSSRYYQDQ